MHAELLTRLNDIQARLDRLLGSKAES